MIPTAASEVIVETDPKSHSMGGIRQYAVKKQGDVWLIDSVTVTLGTQKRKGVLV